jgi:hypothetical protein
MRKHPSRKFGGAALPSFSIIIESENLAVEESDMLFAALDSLEKQTVPLSSAKEAILVNSGRIPADVESAIRERYPWLRIHTIDADRTYYEAKQDPVALTSGEVIVYCDCDCRYVPGWLASLLSPYADPAINAEAVTGETGVSPDTIYGYFIALTWCFPPFSRRRGPYATAGYAANNVSFSRGLLERMPIPTGLRIYRGNCSLHARNLTDAGVTIWKAPGARALHPTLRLSHLPARFFMWGHHEAKVCQARQTSVARSRRAFGALAQIATICLRRLAMPFRRWPALLRRHPASLLTMPVMLVGIFLANVLFIAGAVSTCLRPSMSLQRLAGSLEASEHH